MKLVPNSNFQFPNNSWFQGEKETKFGSEKSEDTRQGIGDRAIHFIVSATSSTNHASVNRPPTPDVVENAPEREPTLQELINIKLIETGEKERLMELLRERLVDCGWKDEMKSLCRAVVKKKGRNNVTVDELVHVITPKGRGR
uniref:Transcription and mRNA export factor ENY2 n=1 Tax=Cajanus cajan TaxID=3821 RepID=A0A151U092_CAJCA|nr:Enhancer of yellow 2 transcription factor isogeny [Cajanus cajan]